MAEQATMISSDSPLRVDIGGLQIGVPYDLSNAQLIVEPSPEGHTLVHKEDFRSFSGTIIANRHSTFHVENDGLVKPVDCKTDLDGEECSDVPSLPRLAAAIDEARSLNATK